MKTFNLHIFERSMRIDIDTHNDNNVCLILIYMWDVRQLRRLRLGLHLSGPIFSRIYLRDKARNNNFTDTIWRGKSIYPGGEYVKKSALTDSCGKIRSMDRALHAWRDSSRVPGNSSRKVFPLTTYIFNKWWSQYIVIIFLIVTENEK